MVGSVRFHYDEVNDIHFAYPNWHIETEADCRVWFQQFVDYFSRFDVKVDTIIVLDDFRIGPAIGRVWGEYRAKWVSRYTKYSVRVRAERRVSTFNATSAAIHGASSEEAPDVATAVERILVHRREAATGAGRR